MKGPAWEELLQPLQALPGVQGDTEWLCHPESLTALGGAPGNTQTLSGAQEELREGWWLRRAWWPSLGGVWVVEGQGCAFLPASTCQQIPF